MSPEENELRIAHKALRENQSAIAAMDAIEAQIIQGGPILALLGRAQTGAAHAMLALVDADADDPGEIRKLQNEVKRFREITEWVIETVAAGQEAAETMKTLDADDHEALLDTTGLYGEHDA